MNRTVLSSLLLGCALLAAPAAPPVQSAPVVKSKVKSPKLERITIPAPQGNPRGIRLKVRCHFRVTNAMDGSRDNEVEMYGEVRFNGQSVWNIAKANAISAVRDLNGKIEVAERTFDVIYGRSATSQLKIDGFLRDRDEGSETGDDAMWNPQKRTLVLDIGKVYSFKNLNGTYTFQGDRNGESADLVFVVSKDSDIY